MTEWELSILMVLRKETVLGGKLWRTDFEGIPGMMNGISIRNVAVPAGEVAGGNTVGIILLVAVCPAMSHVGSLNGHGCFVRSHKRGRKMNQKSENGIQILRPVGFEVKIFLLHHNVARLSGVHASLFILDSCTLMPRYKQHMQTIIQCRDLYAPTSLPHIIPLDRARY
jgi:hypothetical protein